MSTNKKYNIIFVLIDSLRAKELFHPDDGRPNTPFLNRLTKVSYVYTRAIAPSTWTLPSCASIFTGLLPREHRLNFANSRLKPKTYTLAELLNRNGYTTICFSNNPLLNYENGLAKGFERLHSFYEQPVEKQLPFKNDVLDVKKLRLPQNRDIMSITRYILNALKNEGNFLKNLINVGYYYSKSSLGLFKKDKGAAKTKDAVIDWLKCYDKNKPFFLFIHLMETHEMYFPFISYNILYSLINFQKAVKYLKTIRITHFTSRNLIEQYYLDSDVVKYLRNLYKREIEYVDKQLNSLYKFIKLQGLDRETIFVITADHGQQLYEHGALGHAMRFYNVNLHVPLVINLPEKDSQVIDKFVSLKDLSKTIIDYLGLKCKIPGHSFLPNKIDQYPSYVFSETIADPVFDMKIRNKDLVNELYGLSDKIIRENMYGGLSVYYDKYHYILLTNGKIEIYDFENDYNEKNNLFKFRIIGLPDDLLKRVKEEYFKIKIINMLRKEKF